MTVEHKIYSMKIYNKYKRCDGEFKKIEVSQDTTYSTKSGIHGINLSITIKRIIM